MPTLTIDGQSVTAPEGSTILQAALAADIWIPYFCWHPKLVTAGACRVCLVEIEGQPKLSIACADPVREGMVVHTDSPAVEKARAGVIEFILANHPLDCPVCDAGGECDLQDAAFEYRCGHARYDEPKVTFPDEWLCEYIILNRNRCFRCYRCVRYYDEIVGTGELAPKYRGMWTQIAAFNHEPLEFGLCGNLTEVCPLGALTDGKYRFKARPWEVREAASICPGCSLGCNVRVRTRFHKVVQVRPRENDAVNEVWLCDAGRFGDLGTPHPHRLNAPVVRPHAVDAASVVLPSPQTTAGRRSGAGGEATLAVPPSPGRRGAGGEATEPWSLALDEAANALRRAAHTWGEESVAIVASPRLANEDLSALLHLAREAIGTRDMDLLTPPGALALREAFGRPAGTAAVTDIGTGDIVLIGSDIVREQPLLGIRVRQAVRFGSSRLYVADIADYPVHMPVHRSFIAQDGSIATALGALSHDATCLAELRSDRPVTFLLGRDVLESDAGHELTAAALAFARSLDPTGERVRVLPMWIQPNQQGALDLAFDVDVPPLSRRERGPGGEALRCLYVIGLDLLALDPAWEPIIAGLDRLIVQDLHETETSRRAHIVLPSRHTYERGGTFTSMDGRVQRFAPAVAPIGGSRADWWIFAEIAARLGKPLGAHSESEVFARIAAEHSQYAGLTYETLGDSGARRGEGAPHVD